MRRPSSSTVKRWTLKLALCLLAGAVVTWAVAWGCALWCRSPLTPGVPARRTMAAEWPEGFTPTGSAPEVDEYSSGARRERYFKRPPPVPKHDGRIYRGTVLGGGPFAMLVDTGWPLLSMRWRMFLDDYALDTVDGVRAPEWLRPQAAPYLPTRTLPTGFTLDTLLYASVVLGVVEGVGFARRRRRIARGRCPSCGYDRRGISKDAACPECGAV